jgi:hypothetical protein
LSWIENKTHEVEANLSNNIPKFVPNGMTYEGYLSCQSVQKKNMYDITVGTDPLLFCNILLDHCSKHEFIILVTLNDINKVASSNVMAVNFPNDTHRITNKMSRLFGTTQPTLMLLVNPKVYGQMTLVQVEEALKNGNEFDQLLINNDPTMQFFQRISFHLITKPVNMVKFCYGLSGPKSFKWEVYYCKSLNTNPNYSLDFHEPNESHFAEFEIKSVNTYQWAWVKFLGTTYCLPRILGVIYIGIRFSIPFPLHYFGGVQEIQIASVSVRNNKDLNKFPGLKQARMFAFAVKAFKKDDLLPNIHENLNVHQFTMSGEKMKQSFEYCDMSRDGTQLGTFNSYAAVAAAGGGGEK